MAKTTTTWVVQYKRNGRWTDGEEHGTQAYAAEDQREGESYMPPSRIVRRTTTTTVADVEI